MSTLAKEFETTCQLPPSTPQQRVTPPTVLLPATFATSGSSCTVNGGPVPPLGLQHAGFAMPMLGHTLASSTTQNITLSLSPAPSPSTMFNSHSLYPTLEGLRESPASDGATSATTTPMMLAATAAAAVDLQHPDGSRRVRGGGGGPGEGDCLSILLQSPYAATASSSGVAAGLRAMPPPLAPRLHPGSPMAPVEEDDSMPPTPASSTFGPRRSISAFDAALLPTADRTNGPPSRTHSCSSRSGSATGPVHVSAALPLTSPTVYVQPVQGDALWHPHLPHIISAAPAATGGGSVVVAATSSSSAPSARSTPPVMPAHLVTGIPSYPFWGLDGGGGLYSITTTAVGVAPRGEESVGRSSDGPSSAPRRSSQQQQQQQLASRRTGQRARSSVRPPSASLVMRKAATPPVAASASASPPLLQRPSRPHMATQVGPVLMASALAAAGGTPPSATASPRAGRQTPSSPLFLAPALYLHSDPARGLYTSSTAAPLGGGGGPAVVGGVASTSPSSATAAFGAAAGSSVGEVTSVFEARRCDSSTSGRFGGEGEVTPLTTAASRPATPPCNGNSISSTMPLAAFSSLHMGSGSGQGGPTGGSVGATDPLSDCPTRSPSLVLQQPPHRDDHHTPQHSQQHTSAMAATSNFPNHLNTAAAAAAPTGFPGQLTFVPIEVQQAPTLAPFFGSLSHNAASLLSPVSVAQSYSRGTPYARQSGFYDPVTAAHAVVPPMPHLEHNTADDGSSRSSSTAGTVTGNAAAASPFVAATPTRALSSWPPCAAAAAPGVVTAILAAPEVSWASLSLGADHSTTAVGTSSAIATTTNTTTTTGADTPSLSVTRATSPAPWLQRVVEGSGGGSEGSAGHAPHLPHGGSSLHATYAAAAAVPAFGGAMQSHLSCTVVPPEDTESACVICLEGHPRPAGGVAGPGGDAAAAAAGGASGESAVSPSSVVEGGGGVKPGSQLLVLPCRHCCHRNCLQRWLMESTCCPMCRRDLTQDATLPA